MIETKKNGNYSIFLLSLLFFEFINYFLRANSLTNMPLGITLRKIIFLYLIINFLWCFFRYICMPHNSSKIIRAAVVFGIYILIVYFLKNSDHDVTDITNLTSWMVISFLFYYYGFPRNLSLMNFVVIVFVCGYLLLYYKYGIAGEFVGNRPEIVNAIYYLVMAMPFIMLLHNRILKIGLLVAISLIAVLSLKTTAILMSLVSVFMYFLFSGDRKNKGVIEKVLLIHGIVLVFVILLFIIIKVTGVELGSIISSDLDAGGNGRFDIWNSIFNEFKNGKTSEKIFGFGFEKSSELTGFSAHNDFFENIFSFGLVGIVLFLHMFILVNKKLLVIVKYQDNVLIPITVTVCLQVFLIFMFSSTFFVSNYLLILLAMVGMLLKYNNDKTVKE